MWATILDYALITILVIVGFTAFLFFGIAPLLVYGMSRFRPGAPLHVIAPDDPHLPTDARKFFHEVWKQLEPLGFKPTVYARNDGMVSDGKSYIAMFDHPVHADGAAAMLAVSEAGENVRCSGYVAEFCTVSTDGLEVCTNNNVDVSGLYALAHKRVLKFPRMRNLKLLYKIHHLHMQEAGIQQKRPLIPPQQRATELQQSIREEFEQLEKVRCVRKTNEPGAFSFRIPAAMVLTWKQVPGVVHIGKMLLRRRARKWLQAHDLPTEFETIDYSEIATIGLVLPSSLPIPDWYQRPAQRDTTHHEFACETCGQKISTDTDTETGTLVSCPHCAFQMYVPGQTAVG